MGVNLKDEKEVAEYLENLGTEYRFGCYNEKKPEGKCLCFLHKYSILAKSDLVFHWHIHAQLSLFLFTVCHLLGDYFEAIKQNYEKAAKIYQVNCESFKHGHSCLKIGNYSYMGKGSLKQSQKKALEYYDLGCSYKHPESCLHAGLVRSSGDASQVTMRLPALSGFLTSGSHWEGSLI